MLLLILLEAKFLTDIDNKYLWICQISRPGPRLLRRGVSPGARCPRNQGGMTVSQCLMGPKKRWGIGVSQYSLGDTPLENL